MKKNIKYRTFNKKNIFIKVKSYANMYLFVSKGNIVIDINNKKKNINKMTLVTLKKNKNYKINSINGIFNIYYLNAEIINLND